MVHLKLQGSILLRNYVVPAFHVLACGHMDRLHGQKSHILPLYAAAVLSGLGVRGIRRLLGRLLYKTCEQGMYELIGVKWLQIINLLA